ncbi:outer membrane biogenesis protein BamB [Rubripirellula obstinata]|uniref:Outer membrane biogenesis protein BamB n=1 Tax=Rubripirellula obstinata TaxID=406547 RepID=A0A5B1CDL1_9BACT|nr:PQQ-binding-like beta-propeller repeat protein [Rubripirellula obstinata]KAA1259227.1 outer membrane biogenesis protein BamB [Rubripirellula obstinata]
MQEAETISEIYGTDSESSSPSSPKSFRVWVAIAIVVAMWMILIVPAMLAPLTKMHFYSMQLGPMFGAIGLSIWWMNTRVIPRNSRWLGLGLMFLIFAVTMFSIDFSVMIAMLVKGLPIALTLLVAGFFVGSFVNARKQAWIGLTFFSAVMIAGLFVRAEDPDAEFAFDLVPRWKPTAEDNFLDSLQNVSASEEASTIDSDALELPDAVTSKDWAEFRGPKRDGILNDVSFSTDWESNPPAELWRHPIGPGWSSFCVVGPVFYTQEQRGEQETVSAYTVADGRSVWIQETESRFEASMGGVGPRATPTYDNQQLFVTGASGLVQCLDAKSGQPIWQFDLMEQLDVPLPSWGFASSPLLYSNKKEELDDDLVIVFAGGGEEHGTIALDRTTGKLAWSTPGGNHGYSSAQLATIEGTEQVLISSNRGLQSLDPQTGRELWNHEWDIDVMARVTQPTVVGSTAYLGTGYGNGTRRIDISRDGDQWSTEHAWTESMKPYFNDCVYHEGFLYGFDGPIFMCLNADTGEKAWKRGRYGHGQVLLVKEMETLLIVTEKGDLVLAKVNPNKLEEIVRIASVEGITWNHPVIADGKLFVRNAEEMVCYELDVLAPLVTSQ